MSKYKCRPGSKCVGDTRHTIFVCGGGVYDIFGIGQYAMFKIYYIYVYVWLCLGNVLAIWAKIKCGQV